MRRPRISACRNLAFALAAWATRPIRRRIELTYLFHFDLRGPVPAFRAEVPVEMKAATAAEVEEAARLTSVDRRATFRRRLDDGMACYLARIGGRIVAYNWTWVRSGREGMDAIVLRPGEIYTHDAFTVPDLRGRKIHTETLAFILRAAQAQGYLDAFTMVSVLNRRSRKTQTRLGWRLSGRVLRVKIGNDFRLLRLSGSTRPLSAGPVSRPVAESDRPVADLR